MPVQNAMGKIMCSALAFTRAAKPDFLFSKVGASSIQTPQTLSEEISLSLKKSSSSFSTLAAIVVKQLVITNGSIVWSDLAQKQPKI